MPHQLIIPPTLMRKHFMPRQPVSPNSSFRWRRPDNCSIPHYGNCSIPYYYDNCSVPYYYGNCSIFHTTTTALFHTTIFEFWA